MDEDLFEELFSSPESSDLDSNTGSSDKSEDTRNWQSWDPHAGMKPSCWHRYGSEDEVDLEDKLPYGAAIEVNSAMVNLMWELGNGNPCDGKWLPPKLHKPKLGTLGMISPTLELRLWSTHPNIQGRGKPLCLAQMSVQNPLDHKGAPSTDSQWRTKPYSPTISSPQLPTASPHCT